MSMLSDLRFRMKAMFQRRVMEESLEDELRFHFEKEVEKLRSQGLPEEEARRRARLAFGGHSQVAEDCREARGTGLLESALQDARYAVRQMAAHPAFAVVLIVSLALSIGANSAIFSVIHGVLMRPLPWPQAKRLAYLYLSNRQYPKFPVNPFDFRDYRSRSRMFESMAAMTRSDMQLSGGSGRPVMLHGFRVTAGYFDVLRVRPELGHAFDRSDELPGNEHEVVLSNRIWRARFDGSPQIMGRRILLDGEPFTVIGVMPAEMQHPGNSYHPLPYGQDVDLWWPFTFEGNPAHRGSHYLEVIGRLKPGFTLTEADSEMNSIQAELGRHFEGAQGWTVHAISLDSEIVGSSREMLLVLLGAVGMVLLIACANAANLLLSRAVARRREIAVRLALGARRARVIRQLLTESLVMAFLGGALGVLVAWAGVHALVSLLPAGFPRAQEIHVSGAVFAFTFLVTTAAGVLFGITPAVQSSRADPAQGLHEGGRTTMGGGGSTRLRNALVVAEISLACALLVGAGLMLRTFLNLLHLNPGFEQQHAVTATVSLPLVQYKDTPSIARFYDELMEDLRALPGVQAAGAGTDVPFTGYDENLGGFTIEGKVAPPHQEFHGRYHVATPGYFRALRIPLLSGRLFTEADKAGSPSVVIINHSMAAKYWGDQDPVGSRIDFLDDHPTGKDWTTVVGVVGDVKDSPNSADAEPAFWWPSLQQPWQFPEMSIVIRASADSSALIEELRGEVRRLDPSLAVANVRPMNQIVENSIAAPRFAFLLVGLFAALAVLLAAIGIYGVIAYSVSQRTSEFGLRMALGAQRTDVLNLVLRQATCLAAGGTALGVMLAMALGQLLKSLMYGVTPTDPATMLAAPAIVMAVTALACVVPARRATGVDPIVALRSE